MLLTASGLLSSPRHGPRQSRLTALAFPPVLLSFSSLASHSAPLARTAGCWARSFARLSFYIATRGLAARLVSYAILRARVELEAALETLLSRSSSSLRLS